LVPPIGSGTTTSASDTEQASQSAVGDAWKGALAKAQSEGSNSSVNPTTIAGAPGVDVILPPPDLGPRAPPVFGPPALPVFGPQITEPAPPDFGPLINVPAPRDLGPLVNVPAPRDFGPLVNVPAPPDFGPLINVPAPPAQGPLINVPAPQGPLVNYAKGKGPPVEVKPLDVKEGGTLKGEPEEPRGTPAQVEAIKRQNESAEILVKHGLHVERLQVQKDRQNESNPDLKINDADDHSTGWQVADVKSPTTPQTPSIRAVIEEAHSDQRVNVVVVNLDGTRVTAGQLISNLRNSPIRGMKDIYVIKGGSVTKVSYR
jgi:hypothetical protein